MEMKQCAYCGKLFPSRARKKYCKTSCKVQSCKQRKKILMPDDDSSLKPDFQDYCSRLKKRIEFERIMRLKKDESSDLL